MLKRVVILNRSLKFSLIKFSESGFFRTKHFRMISKDNESQISMCSLNDGGKRYFSSKQDQVFSSHSDGNAEQYKTEKALFKLYMNPATEKINMGHFLLALEKTGLRRTDPRLEELMDSLEELHSKIGEEGTTSENIDLPFESFQRLIEQNLVLISQAFSHKLIIPDFTDFCTHVKDIYRRCKNNKKVLTLAITFSSY